MASEAAPVAGALRPSQSQLCAPALPGQLTRSASSWNGPRPRRLNSTSSRTAWYLQGMRAGTRSGQEDKLSTTVQAYRQQQR